MMISKTISKCRLCGSKKLENLLSLGDQPPANSLRKSLSEKLENVPLIICMCHKCTTVQLTETVAPKYLFSDYVWVTGTSKGALEYSYLFAERVLSKVNNKHNLLVIEIASNDGTFLKTFREKGHKVLGIDPAKNLANEANKNGILTLANFFGVDVSKKIINDHGKADIVIARNVIPHVPDPNDVISGITHVLSEDGIGVIEFHWIDIILRELHYDSIYHEHFFYHSLKSINKLLSNHGLNMFDFAESPISGGSLVAYFSKIKTSKLIQKLKWEDEKGLSSVHKWHEFAKETYQHRKKLKLLINSEILSGKTLIGYGASARSSTLLNFCNIDHRHLSCIADQNPLKHNTFTPGTNILVLSPEQALIKNPDTIVILAWNFKDEIIDDLKKKGFSGNVIIPLPNEPYLKEI
jgi:SAM-dependent methyltransferase